VEALALALALAGWGDLPNFPILPGISHFTFIKIAKLIKIRTIRRNMFYYRYTFLFCVNYKNDRYEIVSPARNGKFTLLSEDE